jgi:hypothetical protein
MILLKFLAVSQLSYFLRVSIVSMLPCSDVAKSPGILGDTLAIPKSMSSLLALLKLRHKFIWTSGRV